MPAIMVTAARTGQPYLRATHSQAVVLIPHLDKGARENGVDAAAAPTSAVRAWLLPAGLGCLKPDPAGNGDGRKAPASEEGLMMIQQILGQTEEAVLSDERRCLAGLRVILSGLKAATEDLEALEQCIAQLDELFSLVIVGEFNSGKSAIANALVGQRLLAEGVTPTTTRIQIIKYGDEPDGTDPDAEVGTITMPLDLLRQLTIVDTPGTNAVYRQHEAVTQSYIPRSDVILFVTSVDRPFSESERLFLESVREWGKKVVFVLNKIDILETADEVARVESYIAQNATEALGMRPEIFPISARQALRAKASGDAAALAASRFPALESYIITTLDEAERLRLKLLSPLGVARHLVQVYRQKTENRLDLLSKDLSAIADIEWKLGIYKEDMRRQFRFRLAEVDNALHELENRGTEFLEESMRLGRLADLSNLRAVETDFERRVVAAPAAAVAQRVTDMIDWLVASELRQRQEVMDYLSQRRLEHSNRIVSRIVVSLEDDRARLTETVGQAARQVVESYDQHAEVRRLSASLRRAVAGTAVAEVGALGVGTAAVMLASTALADITGIAAACAIAVLGLFIVPRRRQQSRRELRARVASMRERLTTSLSQHFDEELERSLRRINEAISPYTSFIRAENGYWTTPRDALTSTVRELIRLQAKVKAL
jgi:small GTP-binding protein